VDFEEQKNRWTERESFETRSVHQHALGYSSPRPNSRATIYCGFGRGSSSLDIDRILECEAERDYPRDAGLEVSRSAALAERPCASPAAALFAREPAG